MAPRLTPAQIAAMARARGLDPAAVLAVAKQEGLSGGIGDSGHAFGPFQVNNAGGVITGKFPGQTPEQINQWAWSQPGVEYALGGIQKVAGGQSGGQAVRSIVSRFERPADIPGETARALAGLGGAGTGGPPTSPPVPAAAGQPPVAQPVQQVNPLQGLLQALSSSSSQGGDYGGFYQQLGKALQGQAQPSVQGQSQTLPATSPLGNDRTASSVPQSGLVTGARSGEQPQLLRGLAALARFTGQPVVINSGRRSRARQAQLYANRASNPNPVARPGTSLHEQGLAADGTIGGKPIGTLPPALLSRFGLETVPGDPVHVQVRR